MVGFSWRGDVGVDIEEVGTDPSVLDIARLEFLETEKRFLKAMTVREGLDAFYRYWTAKESFVKGLGGGLALGLKSAEFGFDPQGNLRLERTALPLKCDFFDLSGECERLLPLTRRRFRAAVTHFPT